MSTAAARALPRVRGPEPTAPPSRRRGCSGCTGMARSVRPRCRCCPPRTPTTTCSWCAPNGHPARLKRLISRGSAAMSAAIAALVLLAPSAAQGMTEIGAVPEPVLVRVFPINGPHDLGRSPANNFGGGRGHTGQDMFADCGTPVVASQGGRVRTVDYEGAAGNFIVLTEKHTGLDAVYMHLAHRPRLHAGERVQTDDRIGSVGDTGDAEGCHLHFELWTAPGWYAGGQPFDPLPRLQRWDALPQP